MMNQSRFITFFMDVRKHIPCKSFLRKLFRKAQMILLSGDTVQCPICDWQGAHFIDDRWHKQSTCPQCEGSIRHRLIMASFLYLYPYNSDEFLTGKKILHFAPEKFFEPFFRRITDSYVTADLFGQHANVKLDVTDMPEILDDSYDILIASDVLEHVIDYQRAIREIYRVLSPGGTAVLTVPQKDNLMTTYEDPTITDPRERTRAFGEPTHLRIFGTDLITKLSATGFLVNVVNAHSFEENVILRHVLQPPVLSTHPLATNYRNVYFCFKEPT